VEELRTGSRTERVEPLTQDSFELLELHQANASTREEQRPAPADGRSGRYFSLLRLRAGRRDPALRASSTIALAAAACSPGGAGSVLAADRDAGLLVVRGVRVAVPPRVSFLPRRRSGSR